MNLRSAFLHHNSKQQCIKKTLEWILQILLWITLICKFVPFTPVMPTEGLDPSWKFGMDQAIAQGLILGRDIIFTFGPYAAIYTKIYHPATDHLMLIGSLYLAISFSIALFLLTRNCHWYLNLIFLIILVLANLVSYFDPFLFCYLLLAGFFCFKLVLEERIRKNKINSLLLVVVFFLPFGLLSLIKESILILSVAIIIVTCAFFLVRRHWDFAIIVFAVPILSVPLFWLVSAQPLAALLTFFTANTPIITGYTEAMAVYGPIREIVYYLLLAIALLISICYEKEIPRDLKLFLFSIFFIFLFLAFKAGFVRHDAHATIAATSLILAVLLFAAVTTARWTPILLIFFSLCFYCYVEHKYAHTPIVKEVLGQIHATYSPAWDGIKNRLTDKNWPRKNFDIAIQSLQEKSKFPLFSGTTDIYSYDQAYLIASGNKWNPRPIFQSYSAYTSSLIEKNKNHLLGDKAPNNLIFNVQPIDNRVPSLEDGASWPVILSDYRPVKFENDYLYLHRLTPILHTVTLPSISHSTYTLGEVVNVPNITAPIFVEIAMQPSIWGKLANIFFKPSELKIVFNLANGTAKTYRLIGEMAKTGFLLSPLVENTAEFALS